VISKCGNRIQRKKIDHTLLYLFDITTVLLSGILYMARVEDLSIYNVLDSFINLVF